MNSVTLSGWLDGKIVTAGLRCMHHHDLRHMAPSFTSQWVPVKVVAETLDQSSPTITLGFYAQVMPGMAEEAGAVLCAVLHTEDRAGAFARVRSERDQLFVGRDVSNRPCVGGEQKPGQLCSGSVRLALTVLIEP